MAPLIQNDSSYTRPSRGETSAEKSPDKVMPIAIVGMGCRFPGEAANVESFWRMCAESRDAWSSLREDRFSPEGYYHPDSNRAGTTNVNGAHFLEQDLAHFDAPFFNITKDEAAAMDPQQRLMLECSYEALENAGIPLNQIVGTDTAVYAGSFCRDWTDILNRDVEALPFYQATGTGQALLANRISYFYNLSGPSMSIDTACSSSLVAVHLACQSLRTGETKQAIVGGSNIIISHETMISMSRMRFLSADGRSFAYDHRANGYARGEGAACIVLKPLDEAIKSGDTIRGIIRNTGTNQDGKTNGITLPSMAAQEALMKKVYEQAGLDPAKTSYVEAHGTGTAAGDPLEAEALSNVFTRGRNADDPLIVGSVKTRIGHLEGASGLAGLIKTVLMLENNIILPNGNFEKANDRISFEERKLKVPTTVQSWPASDVRRASVCNYGYGGSNAHMIVEDASSYFAIRGMKGMYRPKPTVQRIPSSITTDSSQQLKDSRLFVLSAHNEASAKIQAQRLSSYLAENQTTFTQEIFDNLAYTLANRRSHLAWKAATSASSVQQLIARLTDDLKYTRTKKVPKLGFVFTGQGAQWHAMGRELIGAFPVFRDSMIRSSKYLKFLGASWSLLDELSKSAEDSKIGLGYLSQPACTAVQVALVDLLTSWGILPSAVTGHSSGEIAAAYAAGALSHRSAIAVSYFRGLAAPVIKERFPSRKGSMLAVGLSREAAQEKVSQLTQGQVVIACVNSPSSVTLSGDEPAINELLEILQNEGTFARIVKVDIAYHSHHMLCIAEDYLEALSKVHPLKATSVKFYSSVTGSRLSTSELQPSYWVTNMVSPVEFNDSLSCLLIGEQELSSSEFKTSVDVLIELGPAGALAGPIKQILQSGKAFGSSSVKYFSALSRNQNAVETSLQLVSELFKGGYPVVFDRVNNPTGWEKQHVLVDLPTYPWNHSEKYWAESREAREHRLRPSPRSDILGSRVRHWMPQEPRWRNYIRPAELPWLRDHKIQGSMIYPAGGYIAMAIEAANEYSSHSASPITGYRLRDIKIGHALVVPEGEIETMISLRPSETQSSSSESWSEFRIYSVSVNGNWTEHCRGFVSTQVSETVDAEETIANSKLIADVTSACHSEVDIKQMYKGLDAVGLQYGPSFSLINRSRAAPYQSIGALRNFDTAAIMPCGYQHPFVVHPGTVDGFIQSLFPGMIEAEGALQGTIVPTSISEMFVSAKISTRPNHEFQVVSQSARVDELKRTSSIVAFDEGSFDPVITFDGLVCSSLPTAGSRSSSAEPSKLCFRMEWEASKLFAISENQSTIQVDSTVPSPLFDVQLVRGQPEQCLSTIELEAAFTRLGVSAIPHSFDDARFGTRTSIVLAETLGDILSKPTSAQLEALKAMLSNTNGTLWVTRAATKDTYAPKANLITGLARTVRLESNAKIITLDLDPTMDLASELAASRIAQVFEKCFRSDYKSSESDNEFTERDGILMVPRIIEDKQINQSVSSSISGPVPEEQSFHQPDRPLVLEASTQINDLLFVDDVEAKQELLADFVEIEAQASDISSSNATDIRCSAHSGVIARVGSNVRTFQIGDRVTCLSQKPLGSLIRVGASVVQAIPDAMSFESAAAMTLPYATAHHAISKVATVEEGETVLIYTTSSSKRSAMVRICQAIGARALVLVASADEKDSVAAELCLENESIMITSSSLAKIVLRRTESRGVDAVVSNSISNDLSRQLLQCVAPFGRFLELSTAHAYSTAKLELKGLSSNITYSRVDFAQLLTQRPLQASRAFASAMSLINKQSMPPSTTLTTFPISNLKSAITHASSSSSCTSTIITYPLSSTILALPQPTHTPLFRPDVSYLLVGGLGGLGRAIAQWMVRNGARHLIFASRRGLSGADTSTLELISILESLGASVSVHACDISSKEQLTSLLTATRASGVPPIRGVINAAMVIRNAFFANLTHEEYMQSIVPKVRGTWNLHEAFAQTGSEDAGLDFFILLSSAIGTLGNPSQAAYGAASTFLDAFASYRLQQSPPLPCNSLALGMISDVGYVAENASVRQGLEKLGFEGISEKQLMGMLEFAVRNPLRQEGGGTVVSGLGAFKKGDEARRPGIGEGRFERYRETCLIQNNADTEEESGEEGDDSPAALKERILVKIAEGEKEGAEELLREGLLRHLAGVLMVAVEDLTVGKSMAEQGLDSLVAVQTRAWMGTATGVSVGLLEVLGAESVRGIVSGLVGRMGI